LFLLELRGPGEISNRPACPDYIDLKGTATDRLGLPNLTGGADVA